MSRFHSWIQDLHPYLLAWIAGALTVAQIVLAVLVPGAGSGALAWAGWVCLWTSGILGVLPILTFRLKGGVPRGKAYVHTTVLVDSGIYAVVRHPQNGTAWLLINLGLMLVAQHWSSVALGLPSMALVHLDTYKADQRCIEKFGDAYRRYARRVPRVSLILGLFRLVRARATGARTISEEA